MGTKINLSERVDFKRGKFINQSNNKTHQRYLTVFFYVSYKNMLLLTILPRGVVIIW